MLLETPARRAPDIDLGPLTPRELDGFPAANREILWGWKRDVGQQKRLVYFSGRLEAVEGRLLLGRFFFCYWTVLREGESEETLRYLELASRRFAELPGGCSLQARPREGLRRIELRCGEPTPQNLDQLRRLKLRRPRTRFPQPQFPEPETEEADSELLPADCYLGSGVSYEAGLPTLCEMHEIFGVDDPIRQCFAVGRGDPLPAALAQEGLQRVARFCVVHSLAIRAEPTPAMKKVGELVERRRIGRVFTDNVDNMLAKVDVPFERVRGTGVFNERYPANFEHPRLVVVGVAADRRQIIRQARARGLQIIVVNPCFKVSPNVVHLDYLRQRDRFFRMTAHDFFSRIVC